MLDDLKYIHQRDKSDALGIAEKQWQQLLQKFDIPELAGDYANVVYAGMGGSALSARLSMTWPGHNVPFEIVANYNIPNYVSGKTLFIACSYSGNTEETISALNEAEKTGATIVVIACGGKLEEIATEKGYVFAKIPPVSQPRFATLYILKALVMILERAGLLKAGAPEKDMEQASAFLKKSVEAWVPTVPTAKNVAKQIAQDVIGSSPVVYAGPLLGPAAYKWKISFNENAKNVAWCGQYPEFNHNEFPGWSSHPVDKPYSVIDLRTSFDHPQIQKRFEISAKLLSGKRPHPITVQAEGETLLEQLLWTVALGDFVSLYTALLNNIDPSPVNLIEKLKKELV